MASSIGLAVVSPDTSSRRVYPTSIEKVDKIGRPGVFSSDLFYQIGNDTYVATGDSHLAGIEPGDSIEEMKETLVGNIESETPIGRKGTVLRVDRSALSSLGSLINRAVGWVLHFFPAG